MARPIGMQSVSFKLPWFTANKLNMYCDLSLFSKMKIILF